MDFLPSNTKFSAETHDVNGELYRSMVMDGLKPYMDNPPETLSDWKEVVKFRRVYLQDGRYGFVKVTIRFKGKPYFDLDDDHPMDSKWRYPERVVTEQWPDGWEQIGNLSVWRARHNQLTKQLAR